MKSDIKSNNRLNKLFKTKENILSIYFTAGFPKLESTSEILKSLSKAGVDLIEIGIPFSDPIADGEVIQESSQKALQNGMSLDRLFDQLEDIRQSVEIPLILMGYLNPIFRYGFDRFCQKCEDIGIDGLIIPDLPLMEIELSYGAVMKKHHLDNIMLIAPNTERSRILEINKLTSGFIYMVSSNSTTGTNQDVSEDQMKYFERVSAMNLSNPTMVGFGIHNYHTFSQACRYSNGAIIGSAFIKELSKGGDLDSIIYDFVKYIRNDSTA